MTAGALKKQAQRETLTAFGWESALHPRGKDGKFIEKLGMIVLSGLGDKKKDGKRGKVVDIVPNKNEHFPSDIKVKLDNGETLTVKPKNISQAPDKGRLGKSEEVDQSLDRFKPEDRGLVQSLRDRAHNWRETEAASRWADAETTVTPGGLTDEERLMEDLSPRDRAVPRSSSSDSDLDRFSPEDRGLVQSLRDRVQYWRDIEGARRWAEAETIVTPGAQSDAERLLEDLRTRARRQRSFAAA